MLVMTAKLSKGKVVLGLLAAVVLLWLVLKLVSGGETTAQPDVGRPEPDNVASNEDRLNFLSACGYTAEPEPVQTQEVAIPKEFNEVFTRYNRLQQSQGFDLEPYAGKRAKRYVYRVTNCGDAGTVCATLIVYKDTVIAADLSSTEGEGFLRALLPADTSETRAAA